MSISAWQGQLKAGLPVFTRVVLSFFSWGAGFASWISDLGLASFKLTDIVVVVVKWSSGGTRVAVA